MIFEFAEIRCILHILVMLNKNKSKYTIMFKQTKVSHTTLQKVLKELVNNKFIKKHDIGHQKVDYEITENGKQLLEILIKLENILE